MLSKQISDFTSRIKQAKQILTNASPVVWNMALGSNAQLTITSARTLSITNMIDGDYGTLLVIQDATGGRVITLPSGSRVQGVGATTAISLSTAANARDILTFWYDGTNFYWNVGRGY